jgi:MoaA/NifB/PqqE/SkfB family radical SAM enzyme
MKFSKLLMARVRRAIHRARTPELVTIAVTDQCQCNCKFCSAGKREKHELDIGVVESIAKDVDKLGGYTISITGGEPLLHKNILKIVKASSDHCVTILFTNGLLLDKKMAKALKSAGLQAIWISLDSDSKETHDKLRCKSGVYDKVVQGIKNSRDAGLLVGLAGTVSSGKVDEIPKLMDFGKENLVNEVLVWELMPSGALLKDKSVLLNNKERKELFRLHKHYNTIEEGPRLSVATYIESADVLGCCAARRWSHITSTGDICPCDFIPLSFGNLYKENFIKVWKRMTSSDEFKDGVDYCRIQDVNFRKKYIEQLPDDCTLPIPFDNFLTMPHLKK